MTNSRGFDHSFCSSPKDEIENNEEDEEEKAYSLLLNKELLHEISARGSLIKNNGGDDSSEGSNDSILLEDQLTGELKSRNITTTRTDVLPNTERTPNEVVTILLEALRCNDEPYENHGMEVFYRFASPSSIWYEYDIDRVASYIKSSKYSVLTMWHAINYPRPLDLSIDGKRAYQLLRLRNKLRNCWEVVSFTLSKHDNCWLVDSVLIKLK
mmetsp:Transcript_1144/g.1764  ORF Transcript_1144/g.1764 Transcript_1144/m.1764 type:complete len:212 (+) Transcript_1144:102-737(+)